MAGQHVSFGVELEFLVGWISEKKAGDSSRHPPNLIRLPADVSDFFSTRRAVEEIIEDLLTKNGIPIEEPGDSDKDDWESDVPIDYGGWQIASDVSVFEVENKLDYEWLAFEVRSPALWSSNEAFAHIYHVVDLLIRNLPIRINKTTGLHVHCGTGKHTRPDPFALQRMACLCWAADGVLSCVHPPDRSDTWARSIRKYTYLALGDIEKEQKSQTESLISLTLDPSTAEASRLENLSDLDITRELQLFGNTAQEDKSQEALDFEQMTLPVSQSDRAEAEEFRRLHPELSNSTSSFARDTADGEGEYFDDHFGAEDPKTQSPFEDLRIRKTRFPCSRSDAPSVMDGIAQAYMSSTYFQSGAADPEPRMDILDGLYHLFSTEDSDHLAHLLTPAVNNYARLGYNFTSLCSKYKRQYKDNDRLTIEFREATGSMDPLWVSIWARVCSRLLEFSIQASTEEYRLVLHKLSSAEANKNYDFVDFLQDLGLPAEAMYIEQKLRFDKENFHIPCVLFTDLEDVSGSPGQQTTETGLMTDTPGPSYRGW